MNTSPFSTAPSREAEIALNGEHRAQGIIHLDADAFFVSVEQAADPRLRGKPVAVGGQTRGVVCSASYEARKCGVYTPMPVARARRVCPGLILIPGDFEKYELFSRLMFSYAYDFTPLVEAGSIDEGYFDVRGNRRYPPVEAAERIRTAIRQSLKLPVSEGIATNKLVAQIASKWKKPCGFVEVRPGEEANFLAPLAPTWLPGIGPHLGKIFSQAGLASIGQIATATPEQLSLLTGGAARQLWLFAQGLDDRAVQPEAPAAKSRSEQRTFEQDVTDETFLRATLRQLADRLFASLRQDGNAARTLTVRLRYNDFSESMRSRSLSEPTDQETEIYGLLDNLLRETWERRVSIRLVSLKLSNFYRATDLGELPLDVAAKNPASRHRLTGAMDKIRQRYGRSAILRGHDLWLQTREAAGTRQSQDPGETRGTCSRRGKHPAPSPGPAVALVAETPPLYKKSASASKPRQLRAVVGFRSCYNFLDSLLTPSEIVRLAVEAGCGAAGLCDPNLHGAPEFFQAAKDAGIRALLGAEVVLPGGKTVLMVQSRNGYTNLCRLLSQPVVTTEFYEAHNEGLLELSTKFPDIRYASRKDAQSYEILQSIRTLSLAGVRHPQKRRGDFSFEHALQISRADGGAPTREIERLLMESEDFFPKGELCFPSFRPEDGTPPGVFLWKLASEGLRRRYPGTWRKHRPQLETELRMIRQVGYEEYFLTVWDLLQECERRGIEWITRGSAADSLVCYSLGISNVCPVRFELYFQRFLNPDRMRLNKLPDIDVDFPHDRKDDVVGLIFSRHATGHVAAVGGFSTFHARSALAETAKVLGMSEAQVRRLTAHLPMHTPAKELDRAIARTPAAADGLFQDEPARTALRLAVRLDGLPRHPKMHPCGIVLSRKPIHDFTPTFVSDKGLPTTHFDMDAVEEVGLVKLDILAQGGLSVLRDTRLLLAKRAKQNGSPLPTGPEPGWGDPEIWRMIARGRARGVHHIESPAMTSLQKMCACSDIDTLVAIVSVIRPGAANTMRKTVFARRALGKEPASYPHPSLEPVLRRTHGVIAYEEHILQICETFAGQSPGRADLLRRALVKNRPEAIETARVEFFAAAAKAGRSPEEVSAVWELVHGFRGYAFCRAHSTAYALEAYEAAHYKCHYPAEFLAAVLTHEKGFYSPFFYTLECRLLGIGLLLPDVNASRQLYRPEPSETHPVALRVPLWKIKGLSQALLERIPRQRTRRPFENIEDFWRRTAPGIEDLRLLARAGALDSLGTSRSAVFWEIHRLARQAGQREQPDLRFCGSSAESVPPTQRTEPEFLERLREEMELLGFPVSGHPLDLFPEIAWETYCPVRELGNFLHSRVTICGWIVADREHHQKDGSPMRFLTLADKTGMIETELFATATRRFGIETLRHPVLALTGKVLPFEGNTGFSLQVESVHRPRKRVSSKN